MNPPGNSTDDQPNDHDGDGDDATSVAKSAERAPRSRKSSKARIHPVDDPDAWRDAVLPDPEPPAGSAEGSAEGEE